MYTKVMIASVLIVLSLFNTASAQEGFKDGYKGSVTRVYPDLNSGKYGSRRVIKNYYIVEKLYHRSALTNWETNREVRFTLKGGTGFNTREVLRKSGSIPSLFLLSSWPYLYTYTIATDAIISISPSYTNGQALWDYEPKSSNEEVTNWRGVSWNLGLEFGVNSTGPSATVLGGVQWQRQAVYKQKGLQTIAYGDLVANKQNWSSYREDAVTWKMGTRFFVPRYAGSPLNNQLYYKTFNCWGKENLVAYEDLNPVHMSSFKPVVSALYSKPENHRYATAFKLYSELKMQTYSIGWDGLCTFGGDDVLNSESVSQEISITVWWH